MKQIKKLLSSGIALLIIVAMTFSTIVMADEFQLSDEVEISTQKDDGVAESFAKLKNLIFANGVANGDQVKWVIKDANTPGVSNNGYKFECSLWYNNKRGTFYFWYGEYRTRLSWATGTNMYLTPDAQTVRLLIEDGGSLDDPNRYETETGELKTREIKLGNIEFTIEDKGDALTAEQVNKLANDDFTNACEYIDTYLRNYDLSLHKIGFFAHVEEARNEKTASCTENGYSGDKYCKECGIILSEGAVIPALGHDYKVKTPAKKATCVEDGKEADLQCSRCGDVIEGDVIPATGHKWGKWKVTKEPTALKTGTKERTCSNCGAKETETIPKLKATMKISPTKKTIKAKKSFTLKISNLAKGDSIKSVKSNKTKIVTVKKVKTNTYKVTGKKKGKAVITVTLKSGLTKKCTVTVK